VFSWSSWVVTFFWFAVRNYLERLLTTASDFNCARPKPCDSVMPLELLGRPIVVRTSDKKLITIIYIFVCFFPSSDAVLIEVDLPLAAGLGDPGQLFPNRKRRRHSL